MTGTNTAAHIADGEPARPTVTGRFAPSPSGRMHLGNVYAALMAWLSVRSQGGRMVLRIEDLDDRCRRGRWDALLIEDLEWLGLDWDEGPVYQSDRLDRYERAFEALRAQGLLYPCFCSRAELHAASAPHASDGTPIYAGTCRGLSAEDVARRRAERPGAWRLRVPSADDPRGDVAFTDRVYGPQHETLARDCGDFLVRRSDGVFAYQLAVCVDDAEMGVNEVVRGRDLLGSSARQMYLQDLLDLPHPAYAHVPLLVTADGRRLSKRERDCDLGELRARFGTPEALLGMVAHAAGIAPDARPRSAGDLVELFSWEAVRRHPANLVADGPR
ncbi:tRNA glutamyl-Q(34) synthetase GluQRS [Collinsella sp. BA40]|uniref:tRNA glutamyl-Q(34) synthetase GluQRS n=1 Tax=Collinsella sp. BA40 TaxID=2560852 RepID=UPI0011CA632A|nr:tRNA glutamyl-Q(34) synthetase GluQRS [Collinsella sp. BA40]TXF36286.1 tRNA glutamyl-Q(34) synthetase GluQRS [Collinsella sp. BA40]